MCVGFFGGGVAQPLMCGAMMEVSLHIAMSWTYMFVLPYMMYLVGPPATNRKWEELPTDISIR